jgi:hypothetical protein
MLGAIAWQVWRRAHHPHVRPQAAKASGLSKGNQAGNDSAQYGAVLSAKAKAEASRDSLYQQIAIIKSIDDSVISVASDV